MRNLMSKLWADDAGVVTLEYLILATILALGLIVGVTGVTAAINAELSELGQAILGLSQSYSSTGFSSCVASKTGSAGTDTNGTLTFVLTSPTPVIISATVCP